MIHTCLVSVFVPDDAQTVLSAEPCSCVVQAKAGVFKNLKAAKKACEALDGSCSGVTDDPVAGIVRILLFVF
jgi:hypothetical protein